MFLRFFSLAVLALPLLFVCGIVHPSTALAAKAVVVKNLRSWQAPDHTRLVFDLSSQTGHRLFSLSNPYRLVLDIENARVLRKDIINTALSSPVTKIRHGSHDTKMRLVFDLSYEVQARSFLLEPNESYGYRLIVDMYGSSKNQSIDDPQAQIKLDPQSIERKDHRDIMIVLDPGHGGEDAGAVGFSGKLEKDVVLAYSKALQKELNTTKGIEAKLTRETDYSIPLRERNKIAHKHRADLFVSVHANSLLDSQVTRGFMLFALSDKAATSEIGRALAKSENRSDVIGGTGTLSLSGKSLGLRKVLIDLSMTSVINHSVFAGKEVLKAVAPHVKVHTTHVEQAAFIVLKSTDIPAILLELGFLSNAKEEALLVDQKYRTTLVRSIRQGIVNYLQMYPPHGTFFASRKKNNRRIYLVKRGDTISEIAEKNAIDLEQLQRINNLKGSGIRVGQKLRLYDVSADATAPVSEQQTELYKVRSGDTLGEIAERFNVGINRLREMNNIKGSLVHPGQNIRLRQKS